MFEIIWLITLQKSNKCITSLYQCQKLTTIDVPSLEIIANHETQCSIPTS
jgi:hypothetical protein